MEYTDLRRLVRDARDESAVARQARAEKADAWNELFRRAQPDLLRTAAHLLPADWPGESVSVILGRVWEKGWRGIRNFKGAEVAKTDAEAARMLLAWLRRVVRLAILDHVTRPATRATPGVPVAHADPGSTTPGPNGFVPVADSASILSQLTKKDELARLKKAQATLSPQEKELLDKLFSGEQSIRQLAEEQGCHESSLRERLKRLLKRLRKEME
jgi:RNA polymerase sigma factor (sigma-70 family)